MLNIFQTLKQTRSDFLIVSLAQEDYKTQEAHVEYFPNLDIFVDVEIRE